MQNAEYLRVTIFFSLVVAIYAFAAILVIKWLLHKFGIAALSQHKSQVWFRRIIFSLSLIGLLCIGYGYFIEPYRISITRVEIKSDKLASGASPIRLVHISDLHSDAKARLEKQLPEIIKNEKPDLIFFTGDSINSSAGLQVFRECLASLATVAPTYVVKGNWDTAFWSRLNLFEGTDAIELNGKAASLKVKGTALHIAGIAVGNEGQMKQALASIPPNEFSIFLYHYPDLIAEIAEQNIDLYCAGHTHGGQIALPFYGALITLSKFGKQYEAGLYQVKQTSLYVNRGIGMEGGNAPRVRFCATPEVTVIDLVPAF
ncbi:MAG: metallophosphoesterase family protein [Acidobacteria bacterium]|nr:metallophosphoesterase family protein [Acidobacteriota bacterium]